MVEKKFEKYYWIAGVVTVTFIALVLAIVFVINPSFKSIKKTSQELKEQKEELKVVEQKLEKLKELKVKEAELKEQSDMVYRAIPTKKEVGDIFIQLSGLISDAGGSVSSVSGSDGSSSSSSTPQAAPSGINTLTYGVGEINLPSYQNFKALLTSSENTLRFVHLTNFKISGSDSFKVTPSYKVYYRGEQATAGTNTANATEGQ